MGKSTINGPFSIAMLVYQRVTPQKNQGEVEKLMLVLLVTVTRNGELSHFSGEKVWVKWKRGFETAENGGSPGSPMKAVV